VLDKEHSLNNNKGEESLFLMCGSVNTSYECLSVCLSDYLPVWK